MHSKTLPARPRHTRTRAGCLTCRARKKKCDEVKPRCAGCRRNLLPCEWPSLLPVSGGGGSSSDGGDRPLPPPPPLHGSTGLDPEAAASSSSPSSVQIARRSSVTVPVPRAVPTLYAGSGSGSGPGSGSGSVPERPCGLTPQSFILLSHYLKDTACHFAMTPQKENPFINLLLPLGYMDDLLMHGLLALSGAHITHKEPGNIELAGATRLHYSRLISGLRTEFANLREDDLETKERLLRVLTVACHYEVIAGDTRGTMFNHLHASRYLISSLADHKNKDHAWSRLNKESFGFSIELYTYLVLSNTFTPYSLAADPTVFSDPFVMSWEEMASFPTFGALFAGSHELFQLLPEVSALAARRLAEEAGGSAQPSAFLKHTHDVLYNSITSWRMPPQVPGHKVEDWEHKRRASEVFRQGLHVYLATALAGSTVSDAATLAAIGEHVERVLIDTIHLVSVQLYYATLVWPIVIAGSCLVKPEHRQGLIHGMRTAWYSMKHLEIIGDVLQLLWEDPDPRAFGPYGLHLIMQKHGVRISVA